MWGNVDSPLNLQDDETEVDARGWMEWAPHEEYAVFTVVVTQGTVSGTGSKPYEPAETTWRIPIKAAGKQKFQKARATATVSALVTYDDGSTTTVIWSRQVDLH